ncbi:DedA family protein [Paenibacillus graminis]|uniref:DedA family protein n=1 Tax=Paenibacillus graminis TaxID=189425 RepID=UPI000F96956C|nr:DedA family protein [Paenibacillus graminis]MEC0171462.1 DedA family protein [Paenibacillus graminis]
MASNTILELISQYGYLIFYVAFTLGPFGIPIPNEITIVTGAALSHMGVINPWITYFCTLSGLITAFTVSYFAGKYFGQKLKNRFRQNRHFQKAELILNKRGNRAMYIGMFIPVVRYIIPLLIGLSGTNYRRFALISYSSAIGWTLMFFSAGTYFGDHILPKLFNIQV